MANGKINEKDIKMKSVSLIVDMINEKIKDWRDNKNEHVLTHDSELKRATEHRYMKDRGWIEALYWVLGKKFDPYSKWKIELEK